MNPKDLNAMSVKNYSELNGGRKMRDHVWYHYVHYPTAGFTGLKKFFQVQGKQMDLSGTPSSTLPDVSNMVISGMTDEPFFVQKVAVNLIILTTAPATRADEFRNVMNSGRLTISVNNILCFEQVVIGTIGSSICLAGYAGVLAAGTAQGNEYNKKPPKVLQSEIFIEEKLTFNAVIEWTTPVTVSTASWLGVELIGVKFNKN